MGPLPPDLHKGMSWIKKDSLSIAAATELSLITTRINLCLRDKNESESAHHLRHLLSLSVPESMSESSSRRAAADRTLNDSLVVVSFLHLT